MYWVYWSVQMWFWTRSYYLIDCSVHLPHRAEIRMAVVSCKILGLTTLSYHLSFSLSLPRAHPGTLHVLFVIVWLFYQLLIFTTVHRTSVWYIMMQDAQNVLYFVTSWFFGRLKRVVIRKKDYLLMKIISRDLVSWRFYTRLRHGNRWLL